MAEHWQQWMPFHIDRWRGSPDVRAMHPAGRMGYLELLCSCWQSPNCTITDDAIDLATNSGLGDELWDVYSARILRKFVSDGQGNLRNEVLFIEWEKARSKFERNREVRSEAGKIGNAKRWGRKCDDEDSQSGRKVVASESQNIATLTLTGTDTKNKEQKQAADAFALPEWIDKDAWQGYEEMRRKIRKPMTDRARQMAVKELAGLQARGHPANSVLDQSTQHSWQGLFELKNKPKPVTGQRTAMDEIREQEARG